jgi:hypothetical protein
MGRVVFVCSLFFNGNFATLQLCKTKKETIMSNQNNTKQATTIVTPAGNLTWVNILGKGKEQLNGGFKYEASLRLHNDSEELKAIKAEINAFWETNKPEGATDCGSCGIKAEKVDKKETGYSLVTFKAATTLKNGNAKKVKLIDSDKKTLELESGTGIGNKSIGKIGGFLNTYEFMGNVGVKLYLNTVQVLELDVFEFEGGDDLEGF